LIKGPSVIFPVQSEMNCKLTQDFSQPLRPWDTFCKLAFWHAFVTADCSITVVTITVAVFAYTALSSSVATQMTPMVVDALDDDAIVFVACHMLPSSW